MTDVWEVPGQQRVVDVLRGAVAGGGVGHAWAFVGPAGVGQDRAAAALVAALVCPSDGCGRCQVCERALRGVHPAYQEIAPTGSSHRVVDVRERWLPTAYRSAGEGGWKVLRILDADRMNESAANAFLKGLEEPPGRTVWLLDITDPDELPDTILSRCRALRFAALDSATLDRQAQRLGLEDAAERALAVRACLGSPARLRALAAHGLDDLRTHREIPRQLRANAGNALVAAKHIEGEITDRTAVLREQAKAERADMADAYGEAPPRSLLRDIDERQARRERETRTVVIQGALDDLAAWYRDVLLVQAGARPGQLVHADDPEGLRADADALGTARLLRALDAILDTRLRLEANVQVRLTLEALLMDLAALGMQQGR